MGGRPQNFGPNFKNYTYIPPSELERFPVGRAISEIWWRKKKKKKRKKLQQQNIIPPATTVGGGIIIESQQGELLLQRFSTNEPVISYVVPFVQFD